MRRAICLVVLASVILVSGCRPVSEAAPSQAVAAPPVRLIVALRDTTKSYCCVAKAGQKLKDAVGVGLGPNDRLVLIDIGPRFSPKDNVRIVAEMPSMTPMRRETGMRGGPETIRQISLLLDRSDARKKPVLDYLQRPVVVPPDGTDLYAALEYVARLLADDEATEKHLVIFSDLEQDAGGIRSALPPSAGLRWGAARVTALFVPYGNDWDVRKVAWGRWFREGGAASFDMCDEALSQLHPMFPPNQARQLIIELTK